MNEEIKGKTERQRKRAVTLRIWNRNGNEGTKEISREKEICGATRR